MEYNKNQFRKINDKKLLHKVGKQWVVISAFMLFAISGSIAGFMPSAHAHTTIHNNQFNSQSNKKFNQVQSVKNNPSNQSINNQAKALHAQILNNNTRNRIHNYVSDINNQFDQTKQNSNLSQMHKTNVNTTNNYSHVHTPILLNKSNNSNQNNQTENQQSLNYTSSNSQNKNSKNDITSFPVSKVTSTNLESNENSSDEAAQADAKKWETGGIYKNLYNNGQYGGTHNEHDYNNGTIVFSDGTFSGFGNYSYQHSDITHLIFKNITFLGPGHAFSWLRNLQTVDFYGNINNNFYYIDNDFYNDINLQYIHGLGKFLNNGSVGDYDYLFRNCKSIKYLDLSSFNTRNIPSSGQYNFDPSNPHTSDGNFGAFDGMSDLSLVKLGNNTILYNSSKIPNNFFPSGKTIANGLSNLDDGQPHPGTWHVVQAANVKHWGSAECIQDNDGDLIIEGTGNGHDTITANRNEANGIDWNSVKHIYTKGVKAPSSLGGTFSGLSNLVSFSGSGMDVSNVKDIDGAFSNDPRLQSLSGLSNWFNNKNNNLLSMNGTFENDTSLKNLKGLSDWNVDNVGDYTGLDSYGFENTFLNDTGLTNILSLKNWNITNTTCDNGHNRNISLWQMFSNDTNIVEFELTNNFNFGNSTTRQHGSSHGDGTPDLPYSNDWVSSKQPNTRIDNINTEATPDMYFNKKWCSQGTIVYKYGNQVLKTYKDWAPNHFSSQNLPDMPISSGYEIDPRNPQQNLNLTPNGTIVVYMDKVGTWGNASWDLTPDTIENSDTSTKTYGAGNLYIHDGQLSDNTNLNQNSIVGLPQFSGIINNIKSINTSNVTAPNDSRNLFGWMPNLVSAQLNGINFFNTDDIGGLLGVCPNLVSADISDITAPKTNNINYIFCDDSNLKNVNMHGFTAKNATDDSSMFSNNTKLKTLDLSGLETGIINTDYDTFTNDNALRELIINSDFRIDGNAHMPNPNGMNKNSQNLQVVTLNDTNPHPGDWLIGQQFGKWGSASWELNNQGVLYVSDGVLSSGRHSIYDAPIGLNGIGANDSAITKVVIGNNVVAPQNSSYLLDESGYYPNLKSYNVKRLDISHVQNMFGMFGNWYHSNSGSGVPALTSIKGLSDWNVINVNNMESMFNDIPHLQNLDLSNWNTQNVTDMSWMFFRDYNLNSLNLGGNFNTTDAQNNFAGMLSALNSLKTLTIGKNVILKNGVGLPNTWYKEINNGKNTDTFPDTNTLLSGTSQPGTYTTSRNPIIDTIHFKNIYQNTGKFPALTAIATISDQSDLKNDDFTNMPRGYVLVNNQGNEINSDKITNVNQTIDVSPFVNVVFYNEQNNQLIRDGNYVVYNPNSDITNTNVINNNLGIIPNCHITPDNNYQLNGSFPNYYYNVNVMPNTILTGYKWGYGSNAPDVSINESSGTITVSNGTINIPSNNHPHYSFYSDINKVINDHNPNDKNDNYGDVLTKLPNNPNGWTIKFDNVKVANNSSVEAASNSNDDTKYHNVGLFNNVGIDGNPSQLGDQIRAIDLTGLDTCSDTDMTDMFADNFNLKKLTFSNSFNTSKVNSMNGMFMGDNSLQNLTLPNSFNTSNVTNMYGMFGSNSDLTNLTLSNHFDTSKVTNMNLMFIEDGSLQNLTIQSNKSKFNSSVSLPVMYKEFSQKDNHNKPYTLATPNDFSQGNTGTFTTNKNACVDTIKFKDIYSDVDGLQADVPKSITLTGNPNSTQKVTLNHDIGWTLVDNKGQIVNSDNFTINNKSYNVNIAPIYHGLTLKYSKNDKSLEFINGQLNWNYGVDNNHSFLGKWENQYSAPKNIKPFGQGAIKSVTFDSGVDTSKVHNFSWFIGSDSNITSINLGNNFNTTNASAMQNFIADMPNITSLDLSSPNFNTSKTNASNNMYYMFGGDTNLQSIKLGENFDTTHNGANISYIFANDSKLSKIDIASLNTKFNNLSGLSNTWHQVLNKTNLVKYPVNIVNLNDYKSHPGTWVKGDITNTIKVNYINQNSDNVGSIIINPTNGSITWPITAPKGYSINGGQETTHTIQASDVDSNSNLTKGDFYTDKNNNICHNIYVTGNKANLSINYHDETNNSDLTSDDFKINGTNAIGDTINGIKIPNGYYIDKSLPAGYQEYDDVNGNTFLLYNFLPNNIKSDESDKINNQTQTIEHMKSNAIQLQANPAMVQVEFHNSDNQPIGSYYEYDNIGKAVTLKPQDNISYGYNVNDNQELNYKFDPTNIMNTTKQNNQTVDIMKPIIVYASKVNNPSNLKVVFLSHNKQIGSDNINGQIGEHVSIKNFDDNSSSNNSIVKTPLDYNLTNSDLTTVAMTGRQSIIYENITGTSINNNINVIKVLEDGNQSSTSDVPETISGVNGSDSTVYAKDYIPNGYIVDNSHPTYANVVMNSDDSSNPNSVIFYYRAIKQQAEPITFNFIEHGQVLRASKELNGLIGETITPINDNRIKSVVANLGYTIKNNKTYTFTNQPQNVYLQVVGQPHNASVTVERFLNNSDGNLQKISDAKVNLSNIRTDSDAVITPYGIDTHDIKSGSATITSDNGAHSLNSLIPSQYHSVPGDNAVPINIDANGNINPMNTIKYIFNKNYQPNNNKFGKIIIHYVTSDNPEINNEQTFTLNGNKYYEVDEESDQDIPDTSFNINPYLNNIPENVNGNYDLANSTSPNSNIIGNNTTSFNNSNQNIFIHVKSNDNNLIILS